MALLISYCKSWLFKFSDYYHFTRYRIRLAKKGKVVWRRRQKHATRRFIRYFWKLLDNSLLPFFNRAIVPQKVKASSALFLVDSYEESNSAVFGLNAVDVGVSWNAIC